ncbi:hypothetical protein [Anabaena sp. UHCC 0204]|uniref:hypothetical protein n=1 Tax=Anabaena sp. UHCC 0204 TaxID=2590009 RepID=UPI00144509A6|nr:hypothetical protein [Anabaena sp. UHCC 0204]MTJ08466.1 hypothetical protein [Anabaena sp. UHCC 0204]
MSNLFTIVSVEQQEIVAGGVRSRLRSRYTYEENKALVIRGFKFSNGRGGVELKFDLLRADSEINEESVFKAFVGV